MQMQVNGRRLEGRRSPGARGRRRDTRAAGPELAQQARREDRARERPAASARGKQAGKCAPEAAPGGVSRAAPADADVPVNPRRHRAVFRPPVRQRHQPGCQQLGAGPGDGVASRTRKWPVGILEPQEAAAAGIASTSASVNGGILPQRPMRWHLPGGTAARLARRAAVPLPAGPSRTWWPPLTGKCAVNINFKY